MWPIVQRSGNDVLVEYFIDTAYGSIPCGQLAAQATLSSTSSAWASESFPLSCIYT